MESGDVRRLDIQGLRGLAVALVVLYHAGLPGFGGGFVGVDVFFVISGYVIGASIEREIEKSGSLSIGRFYARRFRRLFPAFAVCAIVTAALVTLLTDLGDGQVTAARTAIAATFGVANLSLLAAGDQYFGPDEQTNPFLHTWSLGVEEQFYVIVPLLVVALARLAGSTRWSRATLVRGFMWAASAASLIIATVWVADDARRAFYHPAARFWEMAVGVALAGVTTRCMPTVVTGAGLVAIVVGAAVYDDGTSFPGLAAALPVVAACLVLIGAPGSRAWRRVLEHPVLTWLGDRSYGLYLWHWPLIVISIAVFGQSPLVSVVAAICAVGPAAASFRWIERPSQRRLGALPARRNLSIAGASYLAVGGLLVLTLFGSERTWGRSTEVPAAEPDWAVTSNGCFGEEFAPDRCVFTPAGPGAPRATVMVVGDSIAGSVSDGVIAGATRASIEVLVLSTNGCVHLPVRVDATGLCEGRYDELLGLVADYEPELVLFVHAATNYTRGRPEHPNGILLDEEGRPFDDELEATVHWADAVSEAQADLLTLGSRLVVVDQPPEFNDSVSGPRSRLLWPTPSAHVTRAELDRFREPARREVHERVAEGFWIDPVEALCSDDGCSSRHDGRTWYFDASHLNRTGSEALGDLFERELGRLLELDAALDES